jgi:cobalt/nickel transport system permease protein
MRLEALQYPYGARRPLQKLDARIKLVFAVGFVVAVVATPIGHWRFLGVLGLILALLIGLSGTSLAKLLWRWAGFAMLVGFLAAMIAPGMPGRAEHGLLTVILTILVKNSLAFLMMLVLAAVASWGELLQAMRRLGAPRLLVATLQFMERYLHVLGDELGRMRNARRARTYRSGKVLHWRMLTGMIGMLLLRSFERSERVHAAMTARGWDGTIRRLGE